MMFSCQNKDNLLVGTDSETLQHDCQQLRNIRFNPPNADEVIAFLDGYNSFINHAPRYFSPMREINILL